MLGIDLQDRFDRIYMQYENGMLNDFELSYAEDEFGNLNDFHKLSY